MSVGEGIRLALVGASVRAAAGSARRAGFVPVAVDLFADADLCAMAEARRCPSEDYPGGLPSLVTTTGADACLYTGGLENHPGVVAELGRALPLWGNGPVVLAEVRRPERVSEVLREAGLPALAVHGFRDGPSPECWLEKPTGGTGGSGIGRADPDSQGPPEGKYWQEYRDGRPASALFVAHDGTAELLGTTDQLIEESWLNADPFRYCGSVWPGPDSPVVAEAGRAIAAGFGLRGLFGIDFIWADGLPWVTEVNPRYTASAEVIEFGTGRPALAAHAAAFGCRVRASAVPRGPASVGKAILFAPGDLRFPAEGPWEARPRRPWDRPAFADIPAPGDAIEAGWPVLSLFAAADTPEACRAALIAIASEVHNHLFPEMP